MGWHYCITFTYHSISPTPRQAGPPQAVPPEEAQLKEQIAKAVEAGQMSPNLLERPGEILGKSLKSSENPGEILGKS